MHSTAQIEQHRAELVAHCYRMLGSIVDADDAVQETMVRAWKSLERFEGRSSLRTWLYRIATHVCLDALANRSRRARPMEEGPAGTVSDPLAKKDHTHWLEPVPDAAVTPGGTNPAEAAILRQSIRLAFVSALQHLPPRQRAALLLRDVLGCSAAESAEILETTVAALNSALQRARASVANRNSEPEATTLTEEQAGLVERYVDAFVRYDVDALTALMCEDVTMSMPPYALWLQGRDSIRAWLEGPGCGCRGSRLAPVAACGSPAFAQYRQDGRQPWALIVLGLRGAAIASWNAFLDVDTLFPRFGLPLALA